MLGLIGAGANAVGGLFGGGGARAPRMNSEQKQLLQSQANLNNAMAERIRNGVGQCDKAHKGCMGRPCGQGHQCGPLGHQGMNGCGNGFGAGPYQQIMSGFGQLMDMNAMGNFGGGFGFGGGCPSSCFGNQQGINFNFF